MTLILHGPSYDPRLPEIVPEQLAADINHELTTNWLPLSGGSMGGPVALTAGSTAPTPPVGNSTTALATTQFVANGIATSMAGTNTGVFYATSYGDTWDATHDVGPAINAAIAAASAAGGGKVVIPAGKFGLATPLRIAEDGVSFMGAGVGVPRDTYNPYSFLGITTLLWIGAPDATMCRVFKASGDSLWCCDVTGIVFDCNDLAGVGIRFTNVNGSTLKVGVSEPRSVGIWMDTDGGSGTNSPGNQNNDIWFYGRSTLATHSPTVILLDSGPPGAWFNTSFNRFHIVSAWHAKGDGIVLGNCDNDIFYDIGSSADPTNNGGRSLCFASSGYVMPNGLTVGGAPYDCVIIHLGGLSNILGYQSAAKIVAGVHNGTAAVNPIGLITNAATGALQPILNFASTTGLAPGLSVRASSGSNYNLISGILITVVTPTTVRMQQGTSRDLPSGTALTFSFGVTDSAVTGTYTLTAVDATHWSIAAPTGGNSQTNIAVVGGILTLTDVVIPLAGVPQPGDTLILTVPQPAKNISIYNFDNANGAPGPVIEPGANGWLTSTHNPYPTPLRGDGNITIAPIMSTNGAVSLGGIGNTQPGNSCFQAAGFACQARGLATFATGRGNISDSYYSFVCGDTNIADGITSFATGNNNRSSNWFAFAAGISNLSDGYATRVFGYAGSARQRYLTDVWGARSFVNQGDCQIAMQPLSAATTNATVARLTADRDVAGWTNTMNLVAHSTYRIALEITAHQTGGTAGTRDDSATWTVTVLMKQGNDRPNTAIVGGYYMANGTLANTALVAGTPFGPTISDAAAAAWRITVAADSLMGGLLLSATGEANKNIQWLCRAQSVEVAN